MKCTDMEKSYSTPFTLCCVSAVIAGLIPATSAQVSNIEEGPTNVFDTEREESLAKFLNIGPISVRPHFYGAAYYDDNVALSRSNKREDLVWKFAPGVLFGLGEFRGDKGTYLSLDYTGTGNVYTKYDDYDSLDHYVIMSGGWKLAKLTLGLSQSYEISNGKQVEANAFVEQESYITQITSKYELSEKTSFELNGRQSIISTENVVLDGPDQKFNSINEWMVEGWGNYKATEKLTAGVGATFGWRDIRGFTTAPTPNQTFQQALVRALYEVTEKIDAYGSLGIQFSQFQDGDDKGPSFIFDLGASWQPLERTSVALEAYRRDVPSYVLSARNYDLTGVRATVRQLFLEKYTASLAVGYEHSDYTETDSGGSPATGDRTDNYFFIKPVLEYQFNERLNLGLFYLYRTKDSNEPVRDYSNNQTGLYCNYRF